MKYLFQRDDFAELVSASAEAHGILNPAIVEKDYYVTEALRLIANDFGDVVIFKGGTSLSKGWKLINRFSEDIDLYVAPLDSPERTLARFEEVAEAVMAFPGFTGRLGRTDKGAASWTEEFTFQSQLEDLGTIRPVVLLEAGIQSADQPTETVKLTSLVSETLDSQGADSGTDDREPFPMHLLHFRRTFVEKLFTLHSRVDRANRQGRELGRDARHYYDLAMLLQEEATRAMLESPEYKDICRQYKELTAKFYPGQVKLLPQGMNLDQSPALFPEDGDKGKLETAYLREADALCYGSYPSFQEVLDGFESIRTKLRVDLEE